MIMPVSEALIPVSPTEEPPPAPNTPLALISLDTPTTTDGLSIMLMLMERAHQGSFANAEIRVEHTRDALKAELTKFLEQLADALRAMEKAKEDDGGFFGNLLGSITEIVNKVLGPVIEANIEIMEFQFDIAVDLVQSIVNNQNFFDNVKQTSLALTESGKISSDVSGFTEGITRFLGDLTEFLANVQMAALRSAATGEDMGALLEADGKKLLDSLGGNIIRNPGFWAVVNATATGAMIVASGGTATPLAMTVGLALLAAVEVDKKTGYLEKIVGKDLAPYFRTGMQVAAMLVMATGGGTGKDANKLTTEIADKLGQATRVLGGVTKIYTTVENYLEARRGADGIDREADMLQTLYGMQRIQRFLETLLDSLKEDSRSHDETRELGAQVVRAEAEANAAVVIPA